MESLCLDLTQESEDDEPAIPLAGPLIEVSYERLLSEFEVYKQSRPPTALKRIRVSQSSTNLQQTTTPSSILNGEALQVASSSFPSSSQSSEQKSEEKQSKRECPPGPVQKSLAQQTILVDEANTSNKKEKKFVKPTVVARKKRGKKPGTEDNKKQKGQQKIEQGVKEKKESFNLESLVAELESGAVERLFEVCQSQLLKIQMQTGSEEKGKLPKNWPEDVIYTHMLLWDRAKLSALRRFASSPSNVIKPKLEIRALSRDHPAYRKGGLGLFAAQDIQAGQRLLDYAGYVTVTPVINGEESHNDSRYIFHLFTRMHYQDREEWKKWQNNQNISVGDDDELTDDDDNKDIEYRVDIDAQEAGNESRFINDAKGTGKMANIEFFAYKCPFSGEMRMASKAIRDIRSGDEILAHYGADYWNAIEQNKETDESDKGKDPDFHPRWNQKKKNGKSQNGNKHKRRKIMNKKYLSS